jgi:hypothetical protein
MAAQIREEIPGQRFVCLAPMPAGRPGLIPTSTS